MHRNDQNLESGRKIRWDRQETSTLTDVRFLSCMIVVLFMLSWVFHHIFLKAEKRSAIYLLIHVICYRPYLFDLQGEPSCLLHYTAVSLGVVSKMYVCKN